MLWGGCHNLGVATQGALPKTSLILKPTPLHRLDRMSHVLGIDLWIKRDDLTGFAFGGLKTLFESVCALVSFVGWAACVFSLKFLVPPA